MIKQRSFLTAAVVFGVLAALTGPGHADQKFNNKDLKGTWAFKAAGFLAVVGESHTPAAAVGLNTYDGQGGCQSEAHLNAGGTVLQLSSTSCSYTVNSDGTATQTTTYPVGSFTTHIVLVDSDEAFFIVSDPPPPPGTTVASGVLKRRK